MLKFINKFTKKNFNGSCGESVSTDTMSNEQYIAAIEGGILPHWVDQELVQKTGVNNLFAENAKINVKMSYEDVCDCLNRVFRMVDMATYVSTEFSNRSNELNTNNKDAYKNHLQNVAAGHAKGKFVVENDFYSADTIRDLFIEAQTNVKLSDVVIPEDPAEAFNKLSAAIASLIHVKDITFSSVLLFARVASAKMTGFKM